MSSLPRQKGETEFLHIIQFLSLTLMDQGLIHNPNLNPSGYPMIFWGLFGIVALIPHPTQQNFVIGQFAKMATSHWSRHILQYLNQYPLSSDEISTTCTSYT